MYFNIELRKQESYAKVVQCAFMSSLFREKAFHLPVDRGRCTSVVMMLSFSDSIFTLSQFYSSISPVILFLSHLSDPSYTALALLARPIGIILSPLFLSVVLVGRYLAYCAPFCTFLESHYHNTK